mmetsp:Transcript_20883/g.29022  ORF Transcript_20883/g.29022 Transcript_20883/m.29022 type:complete len:239 (-) Transcript_20883:149-865(-)
MSTPTTVGINNNLAPCKTGITVRSSNNKASRWIQMVNSFIIQILFRYDWLNHMFHEVGGDLFIGNILRMLSRNNNGMNSLGDRNTIFQFVLTCYLRLTIWTDPFTSSILTDLRQFGSKRRCQHVCQGHQRFSFICGIPKHNSLITSTSIFRFDSIDRLGNIGRLFFNGNNDIACFVIKALGRIIVSNILNGITDHLFIIDSGCCSDFTKDHHHTCLTASLTGHTRIRITCNASIQNCI